MANKGQHKTPFDPSSLAQLAEESRVHVNVGQEFVITTEDKLRLSLREHLDRIEHKRAWIAPAGILVALVTTLCTATFNETLNLKAESWKAIYVIGSVASLVWLLAKARAAFTSPKLDDVIGELKRHKANSETPVEVVPTPQKIEVTVVSEQTTPDASTK